MDFYTSVTQQGNKLFVTGYKDKEQIKKVINYKPYLFVNSKKQTEYKNLQGKFVDKIEFDSISEAKEFVNSYKEVSNFEIYGLDTYAYMYIFDNFKGEINYDTSLIKVGNFDIECKADEGFPDISKADKEITAISLRFNKNTYVFGCGHFTTTDKTVFYVKCKDEVDLLSKFIAMWERFKFDIITGWNIEFFDIPYTINRIRNVLGFEEAKRLSPFKTISEKTVEFRGKENQSYSLLGLSILDYYQLYRKFTFGNQESYKLDFICEIELGEKKLDYSEYGSLLELYKNNYQKFIEYNIRDVILVEKLEDKLKFIEQVIAFAYDAKINYNDTMTTVRSWDVIIHNYLLEKGIVIPNKIDRSPKTDHIVGGYVKEPKLGLSKWVVSFDLNSLYPHLIMQYNISPETFVEKTQLPSIDYLLNGNWEYRDGMVTYAANGCTYTKKFKGFLPSLMEKMYNDRVIYKNKMIEAKKSLESTKDKKYENLVSRYHNLQLAKKIQLNSAYGALGNAYFRWYNSDHAEAITMSGQLSIRWIENKINEYMNRILRTKDKDYVVASDTDSIYVEMNDIVLAAFNGEDGGPEEKVIVETLDKFIESKIQPYIDSCYQELADMMNAYQQKMKMKRETIANKAIWRGKKMYILNAWNVEGVQYDKPKLKLQGIEAVRSSTPKACRENIKKCIEIIMNGDETQLQTYIEKFRSEYERMSFEEIAYPRGVQGLQDYKDSANIYKKGTPIHVKASLLFNNLLKKNNITTIPPIQDGDKIKFCYLKLPNIIQDEVIATPDSLPKSFGLDIYIDREKQFEKSFLSPIKSITDVIGWQTEKKSTLEGFFND